LKSYLVLTTQREKLQKDIINGVKIKRSFKFESNNLVNHKVQKNNLGGRTASQNSLNTLIITDKKLKVLLKKSRIKSQ